MWHFAGRQSQRPPTRHRGVACAAACRCITGCSSSTRAFARRRCRCNISRTQRAGWPSGHRASRLSSRWWCTCCMPMRPRRSPRRRCAARSACSTATSAPGTPTATTPAVWKGLVADADGGVQAGRPKTRTGKATDGIVFTKAQLTEFGRRLGEARDTGGSDPWPADRYLNIWVCTLADELLGYAQFPGGPAATDGVVIRHRRSAPRARPRPRSTWAAPPRTRWATTSTCATSGATAKTARQRLRRRHAQRRDAELRHPRVPAHHLQQRPERRHVHELHGLRGRLGDVHVHARTGGAHAHRTARPAAIVWTEIAHGGTAQHRRRMGPRARARPRSRAGVRERRSALPPSRGRRRLHLLPDGTFKESRPGMDDRMVAAAGVYTWDGARLRLNFADPAGARRRLRLR